MKKLILADCYENEVLSLKKGIEKLFCEEFEIKSHISNGARTNIFANIKRLMIYFFVPFKYFIKRNKIQYLIGWQQFYALIYCFYCSTFHVKKKTHIIALNFTYKEKKGFKGKIYRWFMKKCLNPKYIDYLHVPSIEYKKIISKEFLLDEKKIIFSPFGIDDCFDSFSKLPKPSLIKDKKYILSIGRSNRDFDFLIKNWDETLPTLVIISDTLKVNIKSKNIIHLTDVTGSDSYPWIFHAEINIIPIDDGRICSGDTVLLTSMCCAKNIIITKPSTLSEIYIDDKENGICIEKTKDALFNGIKEILEHKYPYLGRNARNKFLNHYSRERIGELIGKAILSTNK